MEGFLKGEMEGRKPEWGDNKDMKMRWFKPSMRTGWQLGELDLKVGMG